MHCWARYLFIAVVAALGAGQMISACGQKGDLYLPKPEKETPQPAATGAETDVAPPVATGEEPEADAGATGASDIPRPGQQ